MSQPHQDESIPVEYVAGLFDGMGVITVRIGKKHDMDLGYTFEPNVYIKTNDGLTVGLLDKFSEQYGIHATTYQSDDERFAWELHTVPEVVRFLELVEPHLIRKHEQATLMYNDILPLLEGNKPRTKRDVLRFMEHVDTLRTGTSGPKRKYTADYFRDEWS